MTASSVNDAAASASVFDDLLDGEPLDALLRDDALDWGDDAALASALLGDFASAPVSEHAVVGDSQPTPSAAAPLPPGELLMLHPCLDSTHHSPCAMCCPAPAEGEEGDYELVGACPRCGYRGPPARAHLSAISILPAGADGKKNGEKRLRALLAKTRQWNSKTERDLLAALMEQRAAAAAAGSSAAASLTRLASALRAKRSAMLAKSHLLTCARAWGYASDVWFRHGRATRARLEREALNAPQTADEDGEAPAEAEAAAAAPSATELRLSGGGFPWHGGLNPAQLTADEVRAEVERQLKPLALAAAGLLAGPDARLAAEEHGAGYFTAADLEEVRFAAQRTGGFASAWDALRADAAAAAARAAASEHAAVPAWRRLAGRQTALEATLLTFGGSLRSAAVSNCPYAWFHAPEVIQQLRSGQLDRLPLVEPGEHEVTPEAAASHGPHAAAMARWLNEMQRGLLLVVELALRLQMLVADAKFADYATFCEITCYIIDTMGVFTAASSAAFTERAAWMEQAMEAEARARSPSQDSPVTPQGSSDGSAAANAAPAEPRMLLFRMSTGCKSGCGAAEIGREVATDH
jgi:hypothetical protein